MKNSGVICLSDVLELMLDAVCVVDKQGVFVFVSAALFIKKILRSRLTQ